MESPLKYFEGQVLSSEAYMCGPSAVRQILRVEWSGVCFCYYVLLLSNVFMQV